MDSFDAQQIIPLKEAEDYQVQVRNKQQVEQVARRARLPWNNEYYANYAGTERSWNEAVKYGFISAGGSSWYTRTLGVLEPGGRVWVNRPGQGYLGVGIIESGPIPVSEFVVETEKGPTRFLDIARHRESLLASTKDKQTEEQFVRVRWLKTVPESGAIREPGFFGNQNSAAKPVTEAWEMTVQRLKVLFGVGD